jgi:hypothetical protein
MADKGLPPTKKFSDSLAGRTLSVLLAALTMASLVLLASYVNQVIHPLALRWAGAAGIGLAAGLGSRWLLRENTLALCALTAVLATFCSLCLLGWVSPGIVGIRQSAGTPLGVNWNGLGQFTVGSLCALLAVSAWRVSVRPEKKVRKKPSKRVPQAKVTKSKRPDRKKVKLGDTRQPVKVPGRPEKPIIKTPTIIQGQFWEPYWKQLGSKMRSTLASSAALGARIRAGLPAKTSAPVRLQHRTLKAQRQRTGRSQIHLSGEVEHRCPYCLEVVEKNDRRGVKVCPICQTRHHADCWGVTGVCQVPHQHD